MCCLRYLRQLHKKFNLAPLCSPPPYIHSHSNTRYNSAQSTPLCTPPMAHQLQNSKSDQSWPKKNWTNPIFAIQMRSCGLLKGAASCSSFVFCFNVKVSLFNLSLYLSFSGICYLFSFVIEPAEKLLIISLNGNLLSQVLYVTPFLTIFDLPII